MHDNKNLYIEEGVIGIVEKVVMLLQVVEIVIEIVILAEIVAAVVVES